MAWAPYLPTYLPTYLLTLGAQAAEREAPRRAALSGWSGRERPPKKDLFLVGGHRHLSVYLSIYLYKRTVCLSGVPLPCGARACLC